MTRYDADFAAGPGPGGHQATDFGGYADAYAHRRPAARRNRRAALAFAASAAAVALFTGIIVAAFGGGGDGVVHGGSVPLIQADTTPVKLRPEDPGGMDVPYQDKLVFQRLNPGPDRPTVERLLPPPEQPLPRPVVAPALPPVPSMPSPPAIAQIVPPPGATATVPRDGAGEEIPPAATLPITAIPLASEPAPAPDTLDEGDGEGIAGLVAGLADPYAPVAEPPAVPPAPARTAALPAKPPAAAPVPKTAAPPPAKTTAAGGGWRVQLASVRSQAEAEAEWKRLAGRYADSLAGLAPEISRADLGERGIYYRVRGGSVDEDRARAICAALKSQSVGCVVVRP